MAINIPRLETLVRERLCQRRDLMKVLRHGTRVNGRRSYIFELRFDLD